MPRIVSGLGQIAALSSALVSTEGSYIVPSHVGQLEIHPTLFGSWAVIDESAKGFDWKLSHCAWSGVYCCVVDGIGVGVSVGTVPGTDPCTVVGDVVG